MFGKLSTGAKQLQWNHRIVFIMITHKKLLIQIILHFLTIACMVMIFYFSSQNAEISLGTSSNLIKNVAKVVIWDFENMPKQQQQQIINDWQNFTRKNAHFFIFLILGLLTMATMLTYKIKLSSQIIIAFAVVFLYAVSDEIHQIFVQGRACRLSDVIIDTVGSSTGMAIIVGIRRIFILKP